VRILLDECVDSRLAEHIRGHTVATVALRGWGGLSNGELLQLAQAEFDVFVTVDSNLSFQQHLPRFSIAVVLISAKSTRIDDLLAIVPALLASIPTASKGSVTHIGR
jgi:predicted nuclease of predicted toxin-antitoxin system